MPCDYLQHRPIFSPVVVCNSGNTALHFIHAAKDVFQFSDSNQITVPFGENGEDINILSLGYAQQMPRVLLRLKGVFENVSTDDIETLCSNDLYELKKFGELLCDNLAMRNMTGWQEITVRYRKLI